MKVRKSWEVAAMALLVGIIGQLPSFATDYTWTANVTAVWASSNWSGSPAVNPSTGPVVTDNILFSQGVARSLRMDGDRAVNNVINSGSFGWTLEGGTAVASTLSANTVSNLGSSTIQFRNGAVDGTLSASVVNLTLNGTSASSFTLGGTAAAETQGTYLNGFSVSGETRIVQGTLQANVRNATNAYSLGLLNMTAGSVLLNRSAFTKDAIVNLTGLSGSGGTITGATTIAGGANAGTTSVIVTTTADLSSGSVMIDGTSGGKLALTKSGSATQTLTSDNTYTGGTIITAGRLQLGNGGTTGSIVGAVDTTSATAELAFNRSNAYTYAGVISGSGKVVQAGAGTTTLGATNTYSGGTMIEAGTLQISSDSNLGDAVGTVTMGGGGVLSFAVGTYVTDRDTTLNAGGGGFNLVSNTSVTWGGDIGGTGGLTKSGSASTSAVLYLTGANTYQGGTTIQGGVVRIDSDQNLGEASGSVTFNNGVNTARLEATQDMSSDRALILNGNVVTLSASGTSTAQWNGVISGAGGISKTFSGTVVLGAANTYEGGTTISSGTLLVTNMTGSGTGTGGVVVNATRVLGGTGIIAPGAGNNVSVSGVLSPGVSGEGTLSFNLSGSSKVEFMVGSSITMTLGTASDQIAFVGVGDWLLGSGNTSLDLTLGSGFSYANSYVILSNVSTVGFNVANVTGYDTASYVHSFDKVGDDYVLSFTAVPEPGTMFLLGLAGVAVFFFRRKLSLRS